MSEANSERANSRQRVLHHRLLVEEAEEPAVADAVADAAVAPALLPVVDQLFKGTFVNYIISRYQFLFKI